MARPKATINTVDLTRAIKAMKAAGLAISYTKLDPDGTFTFVTLPGLPVSVHETAEDALADWQANRPAIRLA